MMKLMRSQLKNIMKIEVMKKMKQLTSTKHLKCTVEREKFSTRLVTKFLT